MSFDTISSFQATAVAGKVPALVTLCAPVVGSAPIAGCPSVPNVRISDPSFPTQLSSPTKKPSDFLTPPLRLLTSAPSLIMFDPNLKIPTVHQWSLTVQRELPWGFVDQAAYIGRRGIRLFRAYDINQID